MEWGQRIMIVSGKSKRQPEQIPIMKRRKVNWLNLETIIILQQEGIYPSIKILKLGESGEIEYEKLTVFIEMDDIVTALIEDDQRNTQKYIVSNIKIGSNK